MGGGAHGGSRDSSGEDEAPGSGASPRRVSARPARAGGDGLAREGGGHPARSRTSRGESIHWSRRAQEATKPPLQGVSVTAGATARTPAAAAADAVRDAVDAYHDLLSDDIAADSQAVLDAQIRKRDLFFGDRPLCTVLRPRFMSSAQYRLLQRRRAALRVAFRRAHEAAAADASGRAQFRLTL